MSVVTIGGPASTGQLLDQLDAVVGALTSRAVTPGELGAQEAVDVATRLAAACGRLTGVRMDALSVVESSGVWGLDGSRSPKAYLMRTTGCSAAKAGADLKFARDLSNVLPATRQGLLDGGCTLEQAVVMSSYATDTDLRRKQLSDPHCGERLLLGQTHLPTEDFTALVRSLGCPGRPRCRRRPAPQGPGGQRAVRVAHAGRR